MPIYEYRCDNGHEFEVQQRMIDDPITTCQVCGAPVQRVLHAVAVHFKGSGFYSTDYGKKRRAKAEDGASSGDGGDGGDGGDASSDSSKDSGDSVKKVEKSDSGGKKESPT